MALKYKDKVYRAHRYHELVCDEPTWRYDRTYYYAEELSVTLYGSAFKFRYDPVPGVSKYRKWHGHRYRKPSINGEIRLIEPHLEFVKIRSRRSKYLRHYRWHEDYTVGEYHNSRSWKRTKKRKQWIKGKGGTKRMSSCDDYGIINGCDEACPALLDGNCPEPAEVLRQLTDRFDKDELDELKELYNLIDIKYKSIW